MLWRAWLQPQFGMLTQALVDYNLIRRRVQRAAWQDKIVCDCHCERQRRFEMVRGYLALVLLLISLCCPSWAQQAIRPDDAHIAAAESAITDPALRGHIRFLASDLLEGRGP